MKPQSELKDVKLKEDVKQSVKIILFTKWISITVNVKLSDEMRWFPVTCDAVTQSPAGGCRRSLGEPHQEERLHHRGHLPRPLQVHAGLSRVRQDLGDLRPLLLPDASSAHEEGADAGGVSGVAGPSDQTHAGTVRQDLLKRCVNCVTHVTDVSVSVQTDGA